mmetsp:Transcript_48727/g.97663  ORF Transcript_48727/g.97663 Transcript_48727/m.97663 type:complete len:254 (+) Transcript_48727:728-1489(+)
MEHAAWPDAVGAALLGLWLARQTQHVRGADQPAARLRAALVVDVPGPLLRARMEELARRVGGSEVDLDERVREHHGVHDEKDDRKRVQPALRQGTRRRLLVNEHKPVEEGGAESEERVVLHALQSRVLEGMQAELQQEEEDADEGACCDLDVAVGEDERHDRDHKQLANNLHNLEVPALHAVNAEEEADVGDGFLFLGPERAVPLDAWKRDAAHRQQTLGKHLDVSSELLGRGALPCRPPPALPETQHARGRQ